MKTIIILCLLLLASVNAPAQHGQYAKMSSMVRRLAMTEFKTEQERTPTKSPINLSEQSTLCAFVRIEGNADSVLAANGCRNLATLGDISIADIPLNHLNRLSLSNNVQRIEARHGMQPTLDSMAIMTHATDIYAGSGLPQAYTGKGVVMGLMDVGFDLMHPNFYNNDQSETRIRSFWDQLSTDTLGSSLYVGKDYTTPEAILAYGHSRDATIIYHGTHTAGIAAGNGFDTKYRGMAYESDLCLVSNAVTNDIELIREEDLYKYTYATDALGFKYIFDYATLHDKPCVISFSEGSSQDMHGEDILYYEVLERLSGPGRIIVSSAGNRGHVATFLHKVRGTSPMGTCINYGGSTLGVTLCSEDPFDIRLVAYGTSNDTLTFHTRDIIAAQDSLISDTVMLCGKQHIVEIQAYPSCYDTTKTAYDFYIQSDGYVGVGVELSMELLGEDADVEAFATRSNFYTHPNRAEWLSYAEFSHSINSPSSAPCVICVGATSYRGLFKNIDGEWSGMDAKTDNSRIAYSSTGPTMDGRTKPDVMAPGTNIYSSMGSHYMEANETHPDGLISYSTFQGRQYPWGGDSGTSMASPAVGGIIALWLEADPTLTPDDIKGVLARTCKHYEDESVWPNNTYGYGLIDAYAGLLDILGLSSIIGLSTHQPSGATFNVTETGFDVIFNTPLTSNATVRVYALNGSQIFQEKLVKGNTHYAITLPGTKKGVIAVQLDGLTPSVKGSSLLRMK